ncbi:unnamed protein product, partial [Musa banksii]
LLGSVQASEVNDDDGLRRLEQGVGEGMSVHCSSRSGLSHRSRLLRHLLHHENEIIQLPLREIHKFLPNTRSVHRLAFRSRAIARSHGVAVVFLSDDTTVVDT